MTPQLALRVGMLGAVALAVFAVLFFRLWSLQVLSGDRYLNAAQDNQLRTVRVEAPRGAILDRNGNVLVSNVPGTAVQIWRATCPKEGRYAMFKRLSKVLRVPLPRLTRALEELEGRPAHADHGQDGRARGPGGVPERARRGVPGRADRRRPTCATTSTARGRADPRLRRRDLAGGARRAKREGYRAGDKIGKAGVERAFDQYLRGRPGAAQMRVDSLGRPQSELRAEARTRPRAHASG